DLFGVACGGGLVGSAVRFFEGHGKLASHNRPYSGGYVLDRHASLRRGVHAMQLEICRSTYLDSRLEHPSARLSSVAKMLAGLVRLLGEEASRLADNGFFAQAAE
ncbi:MAG TPA: N-formylglutamate amidohydrolase, partial [Erythrobacter sp.]|nr:N-formylglutamate amidohydrolase [Erythrobacter sp.]